MVIGDRQPLVAFAASASFLDAIFDSHDTEASDSVYPAIAHAQRASSVRRVTFRASSNASTSIAICSLFSRGRRMSAVALRIS
jgi:hypothetical protein